MKRCLSIILVLSFLLSVFFVPTALAYTGSFKIYGLYLTKEGDSTLLNMDGNWLLMDVGSEESGDELVEKLQNEYGISKLDLYISHLHSDHYGAYKKIADNFLVGKLYLPDYNVIATEYENNISVSNKIINYLSEAEVVLLKKGSSFKYGNTTATVLGPVGNYTPEEADDNSENYINDRYGKYLNNYSLTTKFVCGKYSFLTCGDIESEEEEALLKTYNNGELKADIMKFSHHGISTSNKLEFLKAVDADYFYALNSTYTYMVDGSNGKKVRCAYSSIENASNFGIPYMVGDEKKDFCASISTSGINIYKGSIKDENKYDKWVKVFGATGRKNDEYDTYYIKDGKILTGISVIDGKKYYLSDGGCLIKGYYEDGVYYEQRNFPDGTRAFKESGEMYAGFATVNGYFRYFDTKTGVRFKGAKNYGLYKISSKYYAINDSGVVFKGGWKKFGSNYRYFDKTTGVMKTGWLTVGSKKYYLDKSTGYRTLGLKKIGSKTYYFVEKNKAGYLYCGGWKKFGKKYRYFDKKTGVMKTSWLTVGSKKYYLDKKTGYRTVGLKKIGKSTYYFVEKNNAGYVYRGGWKKFKNKYRYFSKTSGKMKKGWQKIGGKKYYFDSKGFRVTGKKKIGKKTYKFSSKGVLKK